MQFLTPASYPEIARMIRGELPKVSANRRVFNAFVEFGQFTAVEALRAICWGQTPKLAVKSLPTGRYGYYPGNGDEIQISGTIAQQYENLMTFGRQPYGRPVDWDRLLRRATKMVEAIILHEMVHWHDNKSDGDMLHAQHPKGYDWGGRFEIKAYGQIVSVKDIEGWMGWRWIRKGNDLHGVSFDKERGYPHRLPPGAR